MKRLLLALALAAALPACDSEEPLSDPQKAKLDERLLGVWKEAGRESYLFVGRPERGPLAGSLRVVLSGYDPERQQAGTVEFRMATTTIGKHSYGSIFFQPSPGQGKQPAQSYVLVKYAIDHGLLTVWSLNKDVVADAINQGKVKGQAGSLLPFRLTSLHDSPDNLRRFVQEWEGKGLFREDNRMVFARPR